MGCEVSIQVHPLPTESTKKYKMKPTEVYRKDSYVTVMLDDPEDDGPIFV